MDCTDFLQSCNVFVANRLFPKQSIYRKISIRSFVVAHFYFFVKMGFWPWLNWNFSEKDIHQVWFDIKRSFAYHNQRSSHTVWKVYDFSITQILREINFLESRSSKPAVFAILGALNFVIWAPSKGAESHENKNSDPLNV